jgi:hypothetical protein
LLTIAEDEKLIEKRVASATCDYRDYYRNARDAILGRGALAVTPQWALDVMRLLELCRESSKRRCTIPW